jgi:hypothetical protein
MRFTPAYGSVVVDEEYMDEIAPFIEEDDQRWDDYDDDDETLGLSTCLSSSSTMCHHCIGCASWRTLDRCSTYMDEIAPFVDEDDQRRDDHDDVLWGPSACFFSS